MDEVLHGYVDKVIDDILDEVLNGYNTIQNHGFISSLKCDEIANKSIISP